MYKAIDLFAGAGGMSLGFMQSKEFEIKVAFENNPSMQKTYKMNHPHVDVRGDVCEANYKSIQEIYGPIDVVIGGPPCQGFSNANRQKNYTISQNNMLVKQYIRAVKELQPMAFVMENVSMLRSSVHRFYLDKADNELFSKNSYSVPMTNTRLVLLEEKYVFEGAFELIQSKNSILKYLWSNEVFSTINVIYKALKNPKKLSSAIEKHLKKLEAIAEDFNDKQDNSHIIVVSKIAINAILEFYKEKTTIVLLREKIEPAIMIQRMLNKAKEVFDNNLIVEKYGRDHGIYVVIKTYAVYDYIKAILCSPPNNYTISAKVLCAADYGAPQKRNRFIVIGMKKEYTNEVHLPEQRYCEASYRTVHDAISDLENIPAVTKIEDDVGIPMEPVEGISELGKALRDAPVLFNHITTNTRKNAMERFKALKQGQNFHSLEDSLKVNTYTDVSRTQNTIYLRLDYNRPSGTVVNVRKSMWVHPVLDRAVSVREAARLQSFPDSFVFCGTKDKQYQQVGNAVPPIMAKAIATELAAQLNVVGKRSRKMSDFIV